MFLMTTVLHWNYLYGDILFIFGGIFFYILKEHLASQSNKINENIYSDNVEVRKLLTLQVEDEIICHNFNHCCFRQQER